MKESIVPGLKSHPLVEDTSMGYMTNTQTLFDCPACHKPVTGRVRWTVEEWDAETKLAKMSQSGVTVNHDCMPKVMR